MFDFTILNDAVTETFGEPVVIRRTGFPDLAATAVYDSVWFEVDDGEAGGSSRRTQVSVRSAETGSVRAGAVVAVRGVDYRVTDARPDAEGVVILILERAP